MKLSKAILYGLLIVSLLLPYIAAGHAAAPPNYVGLNQDQEFIWDTEFDKGPLKDFIEDQVTTDPEGIDILTDAIFDQLEFDEDIVSWKVIVSEIGEDDDKDYDGALEDEDDVGYVKIRINIYEKEEGEEWDDLDKAETYKIWENEEIVYSDFILASFEEQDIPFTVGTNNYIWSDESLGMGLYYYQIVKQDDPFDPIEQDPFIWDVQPEWPMFFIPKNLDFDDIADDCDEWIEDYGFIGQYGGILEDHVSVGAPDVNYFFKDKEVGLWTNVEFLGDVEEFDSEIRFNNDGIMYYYEWTYDGDIIAKFELTQWGFSAVYITENWWWIALIAGAVIVGLIVLIVYIIIRKKRK
ncbi:MAG: hypothetical protein EU540_08360 [Promethearchaeota archaeon]|nr:MAG: hypothetical protein EU540_08360 [Candidatus Lokiarchaeota archaeon]